MKMYKPLFWKNKNILSYILYPISLIYTIFLSLLSLVTKEIKFNTKIICVGNIYLGGTGKTPLSIHIVNLYEKKIRRTYLVKKFYKYQSDEVRLIERNVQNFISLNKRQNSIKEAEKKGAELIVMDDGFQDWSIKKDVSIICFDSNEGVGNEKVLPAGPLREPLDKIKKAQIAVIKGGENKKLEELIITKSKDIKIFYMDFFSEDINKLKGKNYLAFAGIGNPENFFDFLKINEINIFHSLKFPDHYDYKRNDLEEILNISKQKNLNILTTEKDYYRLPDSFKKHIEFIKINVNIKNEDLFKNEIDKYIK
tara:strand:- start:1862 stop:2791 length:930 start_codon:yes stop_codon:yes gene_type:complete